MKKINIFVFALMSIVLASCMDGGYDTPDFKDKTPYGNNDLKETNLVSIADLKSLYPICAQTISGGVLVEDNIQIKGIVTANDIEGNVYNEIMLQDETGAIGIEIEHGGMFGILPEGTEILVELKGLHIGNYRGQIQAGALYSNTSGEAYPSRMPFNTWEQHYKITGKKNKIEPVVFGDGNTGELTWNYTTDGGKLGTLKNVTLSYYFDIAALQDVKNINENTTYASGTTGSAVSWYFKEKLKNSEIAEVQFYNSAYSDFAAAKIPYGKKLNITGVIKCYNSKAGTKKQCEIIVRQLSDIEVVAEEE